MVTYIFIGFLIENQFKENFLIQYEIQFLAERDYYEEENWFEIPGFFHNHHALSPIS